MEKGESIVFSAGLKVAETDDLHDKFNEEIGRRIPRDNFENCLKNSAGQFISRRDGETRVIAGYPWFGWWGRDTFIALPGITLTMGDNKTFLDVMDSMSKDLQGAMFPNVGSGVLTNMNSIDAPLWYFWTLQQYIIFTGDKETIKSKYIEKCKGIIDGFKKGTVFKIHVKENGLISGGVEGVGLTWMDAVTKDGPVTPRIGSPVEINALWYNALCFYHELTGDEEVLELSEKVALSFVEGFWSEKKGYLADVIDDEGKDWSIRPNMVFATSLPYSPLTNEQKDKVLEMVKANLFTNRGLRTLAPSDPRYKGYYKGDQNERDNAYHQGTAWPWLLGHFAEGYLKLHGKQGKKLVENMISSFDEVMTQYGIGTIAEIYEGDPPHRPKGAISQAWSVGELLRMKYLINNL
ncbi:putative glycogen debranching enzyme, archaeal type, TIGR01561 [Cyclobacterium qasimii M12-11B]|uniref:Putative glycogen debranching enzyme, archaeal type, TIGR01561 n=2 Tax=Cyclobacterium qasimii TaxID=1350429 RepID=S7VQ56_9BACT|nr:putative glycogen debranching enzyme, archaeal type, TIGR01561 [Cyclobacterium qasimii M12-11B]